MKRNIAIIGAGISGMSSALQLDETDAITIYAKAFSPDITSNRAAAFWFPYHIRNDRRGISWCQMSYDFYKELAQDAATGISMKRLIKVLRKNVVEEEPVWMDFMPKGSYRLMDSMDLPIGVAKGYDIKVPLIETQIFLPYLRQRLEHKGVRFYEKEIMHFSEIANSYDLVINCSGLGSRKLCGDNRLVPVRGQVALLSPKKDLPIYLDNEKPLYIVPRNDAIIVGGTYEEGIESEETDAGTIASIVDNARGAYPELQQHEVIGSWAGLRPYRPEVRVELEPGTNIIHNYGHGGSGFTLAFGCANEVAAIARTFNFLR